jgi:hypothetical protein
LDEVEATAGVERDRLAYYQGAPLARLDKPAAGLKNPGRGQDQRENASQDADNQEQGLRGHSMASPGAAARRLVRWEGLLAAAFVRMQSFGTEEINKCLTGPINLLFNFLGQSAGHGP